MTTVCHNRVNKLFYQSKTTFLRHIVRGQFNTCLIHFLRRMGARMKFVFTKHVIDKKIPRLREIGIIISEQRIKRIIGNPDHIDSISDLPNIIVSKKLDKNHVLRVVYKFEGDIIKVITIYPAEKGRYY